MQTLQLHLQAFKQSEDSHFFAHWQRALCLQEVQLLLQTVWSFEEAHGKVPHYLSWRMKGMHRIKRMCFIMVTYFVLAYDMILANTASSFPKCYKNLTGHRMYLSWELWGYHLRWLKSLIWLSPARFLFLPLIRYHLSERSRSSACHWNLSSGLCSLFLLTWWSMVVAPK